jgi:hypothetical protein
MSFCSCATTYPLEKGASELVALNQEMRDWSKDGELIICNSLSELARLINGGAPFYIERGAKRVVFQDYKNAKRDIYINLEIYQMGNNKEAESLFNDVFVDQPIYLPDIGERCRMAIRLIGVYSMDFFKENIYARLTITEKSDASKNELENFAKMISNNI